MNLIEWFRKYRKDRAFDKKYKERVDIEAQAKIMYQIREHDGAFYVMCDGQMVCPVSMFKIEDTGASMLKLLDELRANYILLTCRKKGL